MDLPRLVGPRVRVPYLAAVVAATLLLPGVWLVALVAVQLALALAVGLPPRRLGRQLFKFWAFALFIVGSYALTEEDPSVDRWVRVDLFGWELNLNAGGAVIGAFMVARVLAVVLASHIARAGDPRAVAQGLSRLGVPNAISVPIDSVLALMGPGGGGGGGRGTGGGRHRQGDGPEGGFRDALKRLSRGDVSPIAQRMRRQIDRAEAHTGENDAATRDTAVIVGLALTMLGIKALKILPSIPFAPGHKLVLLTPLYVVASLHTRGRFGSTLTGLTMGTVAFLMGDGRYGIFEIVKHVAPGVICDLGVPLLTRGGRRPGGLTWCLFGGLVAAGRFATIFAVTFLAQAPKIAYAILIPGLTVHLTFGVLSGYMTYHLIRAVAPEEEGQA